ncbi:hypothetical protein PoB_002151600 [Plakobranchus ocellatus]|uniref:Uncharacterized protein n=1 Tax=Plakobranchus ocellatus TaxID=259542 RepID=A0AAV3ZGH5_9GAST|nr:hypothetical protein PoB_002151600 [Plakobranchus ocellatus]
MVIHSDRNPDRGKELLPHPDPHLDRVGRDLVTLPDPSLDIDRVGSKKVLTKLKEKRNDLFAPNSMPQE